jgi:hypothetical protein
MIRSTKPSFISPTPELFVESALKTVEIADETAGYQWHAVATLNVHILNYLAPTTFIKISRFVMHSIFRTDNGVNQSKIKR